MVITEQHILESIADARRGELNGHTYDQSKWCGTSCCVLGFARLRAGLPEINDGPQPGEIEDTPRARMLAALMNTPSPSVLDAMELVQPDGSITYSGSLYLNSLTSIPAGVTLKAGGQLDLISLTSIPAGVTLKAGGDLYLGSLTSIPEGVTLKAGGDLYLGSLTSIPEGVTLKAGGDLYLGSLTSIPEGYELPSNAYAPKLRRNA